MPYKDKEKQKLYNKERMRGVRGNTKGSTSGGNTKGNDGKDVLPKMTKDGTYFKDGVEMVPPSYVQGLTGVFEALPERPRYLTLSDGQVLDRANPPTALAPNAQAIKASNESEYNYHPNSGAVPRMRGIKQGI